MTILKQFSTPAKQNDFPNDPAKAARFRALWSRNVECFTQQAIAAAPTGFKDAPSDAPPSAYFDPLSTDIPSSSRSVAIQWQAFPGRIKFYFPDLPQEDQWSLADTGMTTSGIAFGQIPKNMCDIEFPPDPRNPPPPGWIPFGPYGPRGWQDEYSEWAVTRNAAGKIVRIDFTCENPEYWHTLWRIDPQRVCELYRGTLDKPQIQLEDLYLRDASGKVVNDPSTGLPAYNPLNPWNRGTVSTPSGGGAMHLTSTPNTLQTEFGLASAGTMQLQCDNNIPSALICCGVYGQVHRNSDPHIGMVVKQATAAKYFVALTDPAGLYIQRPDFGRYILPANAPKGATAGDYWRVVRGAESMTDQNGNPIPGNLYLHCVFEVPAKLGFTVGDIQIMDANGVPQSIRWASQVADTFFMQINGIPIAGLEQKPNPCAQPNLPVTSPSIGQVMFAALWDGYYSVPVPNVVGFPMTLASNTVIVPAMLKRGQTAELVMTATLPNFATVSEIAFPQANGGDSGVTVTVGAVSQVYYAVPGNSYPNFTAAIRLTVRVDPTAAPGLRSASITCQGGDTDKDPKNATNTGPAYLVIEDPSQPVA